MQKQQPTSRTANKQKQSNNKLTTIKKLMDPLPCRVRSSTKVDPLPCYDTFTYTEGFLFLLICCLVLEVSTCPKWRPISSDFYIWRMHFADSYCKCTCIFPFKFFIYHYKNIKVSILFINVTLIFIFWPRKIESHFGWIIHLNIK